jgi:hypothetical protein
MQNRGVRGAVAAAIAATVISTGACSGQIAGAPSDGGAGHDAVGVTDEGGVADSGSPPPYDSGGSPMDASSPPPQGDTCQTPGVTCTVPPSPPSGATPPPTGTSPHDYAIHQLYLGDTDRNGIASSDAWAAFGYNLDDLVTTEASTDVCSLAAGASKTTQVDGNGGIDNSFGANVLPILITVGGAAFSQKVNAEIVDGAFTDLVYVTGFTDTSGNTTSASGLTGVLLSGGDYATVNHGPPAWTLATSWPVEPESLTGCPAGVCPAGTDPIASAAVKFSGAYQRDGTFVNGGPVEVSLSLALGGASFPLTIHAASLTFAPDVPGSVTDGTIAGALLTTELIAGMQSAAGSLSPSLCSASAFQSIAQQVEQASDIVLSPSSSAVSNAEATPCNAISIGLGFEGSEIAIPASADITGPTPSPPNPCGDQ